MKYSEASEDVDRGKIGNRETSCITGDHNK